MASTVATIKIDDNDLERIIPLMQTAAGVTPIRVRLNDAEITAAIRALEVAAGVTPLHLQLDRKDWVAALVGVQIKLNQRTCTISIATPAVVTLATHGFLANQPIRFQSTGALPTGLTIGPTYYVSATGLVAGSFQVSGSPGGASIATTGTQSGVHVVFPV
jgi:hypothetical protein